MVKTDNSLQSEDRVQQIDAPPINYDELAEDQSHDEELRMILDEGSTSSLNIKRFAIPFSNRSVYCDISNDRIRPFVTRKFRQQVLRATHGLSHPGSRATLKLMCDRFVWPEFATTASNLHGPV